MERATPGKLPASILGGFPPHDVGPLELPNMPSNLRIFKGVFSSIRIWWTGVWYRPAQGRLLALKIWRSVLHDQCIEPVQICQLKSLSLSEKLLQVSWYDSVWCVKLQVWRHYIIFKKCNDAQEQTSLHRYSMHESSITFYALRFNVASFISTCDFFNFCVKLAQECQAEFAQAGSFDAHVWRWIKHMQTANKRMDVSACWDDFLQVVQKISDKTSKESFFTYFRRWFLAFTVPIHMVNLDGKTCRRSQHSKSSMPSLRRTLILRTEGLGAFLWRLHGEGSSHNMNQHLI